MKIMIEEPNRTDLDRIDLFGILVFQKDDQKRRSIFVSWFHDDPLDLSLYTDFFIHIVEVFCFLGVGGKRCQKTNR